jgi:hypothetical protein
VLSVIYTAQCKDRIGRTFLHKGMEMFERLGFGPGSDTSWATTGVIGPIAIDGKSAGPLAPLSSWGAYGFQT